MQHLDLDSETAREIEPDLAQWGTVLKTNTILADIYDAIAILNANIVAIGTKKHAKEPKRYSRPTDKQRTQLGGKGALPPDEMAKWIERKRKEHNDQEVS